MTCCIQHYLRHGLNIRRSVGVEITHLLASFETFHSFLSSSTDFESGLKGTLRCRGFY